MTKLVIGQIVTILPENKCYTPTGRRGYFNINGRNLTGFKGYIETINNYQNTRKCNYVTIVLYNGSKVCMLECETEEFYKGLHININFDPIPFDTSTIKTELEFEKYINNLVSDRLFDPSSRPYYGKSASNNPKKIEDRKEVILLTKSKFIKINQND